MVACTNDMVTNLKLILRLQIFERRSVAVSLGIRMWDAEELVEMLGCRNSHTRCTHTHTDMQAHTYTLRTYMDMHTPCTPTCTPTHKHIHTIKHMHITWRTLD